MFLKVKRDALKMIDDKILKSFSVYFHFYKYCEYLQQLPVSLFIKAVNDITVITVETNEVLLETLFN